MFLFKNICNDDDENDDDNKSSYSHIIDAHHREVWCEISQHNDDDGPQAKLKSFFAKFDHDVTDAVDDDEWLAIGMCDVCGIQTYLIRLTIYLEGFEICRSCSSNDLRLATDWWEEGRRIQNVTNINWMMIIMKD